MSKLTPYQRIVRNARRGQGVRLSAAEVWDLAADHAIAARADLDDANDRGISDNDANGYCPRCDHHAVCVCPRGPDEKAYEKRRGT